MRIHSAYSKLSAVGRCSYDTLSGYLIDVLGRIPSDDEQPVIETKLVTYKIEEYEDRRIIWVKACKNNADEIQEDEQEEIAQDEDNED